MIYRKKKKKIIRIEYNNLSRDGLRTASGKFANAESAPLSITNVVNAVQCRERTKRKERRRIIESKDGLAWSDECIGWTAGRASRLQTFNKNILVFLSPDHRLLPHSSLNYFYYRITGAVCFLQNIIRQMIHFLARTKKQVKEKSDRNSSKFLLFGDIEKRFRWYTERFRTAVSTIVWKTICVPSLNSDWDVCIINCKIFKLEFLLFNHTYGLLVNFNSKIFGAKYCGKGQGSRWTFALPSWAERIISSLLIRP